MDRRRAGGRPMYKAGKVEGQEITDILLDTGCSRTMHGPSEFCCHGEGHCWAITCAHALEQMFVETTYSSMVKTIETEVTV